MRMDLKIGHKTFATKAEAERYIRDIFARYRHMGVLIGEDLEFALALIDMHPSRKLIIDCGIRSICVQEIPLNESQKRFLVVRTDHSLRDFSWRKVIYPKSAAGELASVLRHLIEDQKGNFKQAHFGGVCVTCGTRIAQRDCHVDHAHPMTFERLMQDWLKCMRLSADDVDIIHSKGYEEHSCLEDQALSESWIEYHEINAKLRCVCKRCNLSTLRRAS